MALGSVYASVYCDIFALFTRKKHCPIVFLFLQFNLVSVKEIEMIHAMALGSVYASIYNITFTFFNTNQHHPIQLFNLQFNLLNGSRRCLHKHNLCQIWNFHLESTFNHTVVFSSTEFGKWERDWNDSCHGSKLSLRKRLLRHIYICH